jgi:hypothetical protein
MRDANIKTMQGEMCPWPRTAAMPHIAYHPGFNHLSERAVDVVTWLALVLMVVSLYAVIFVAIYRWSVYAPIFQPDNGVTAEEPFPWPQ